MALGMFDTEHCFKHQSFAFLYVLPHGVKVGGEAEAVGQDSLAFFAFALAIELFPPFADVFKLRHEVFKDFNFVAFAVEEVANG